MIRVIVTSGAERDEVLRRHDFAPLFGSAYVIQEQVSTERTRTIGGGGITTAVVLGPSAIGSVSGGGGGAGVTIRHKGSSSS